MNQELAQINSLTGLIQGWLTPLEGELLYRLAKSCTGRGVIVEIGSYRGKSTIWLAKGSQAGKKALVFAVDPHTGSFEYPGPGADTLPFFRENILKAGVTGIVHPFVMTSEQAARQFDRPIELLFIDGSHEYTAVRQDFELWVPKLIPGGVIAMHDSVHSPGPARVARDGIYLSRGFREARFVHSTTYAVKVAQNTPSDRLKNLLRLALLSFYALTGRLPLPAGLKRLTGAAIRRL